MKKIMTLIVSLAFLFSVAIAPVWAGGGKNQNEIGAGDAPGPGDDNQSNQAS